MNPQTGFPRELKFLRFVFGLGACAGLFLLIIGLLAFFVGNVLSFFNEDPGSLTWTINFLAYGILGTFVSIRVYQLLRNQDTSSPDSIVMWVWWLVIGEIVLGFISYLYTGALIDLFWGQIQNLVLWWFFYVVVSSQFRFLKVVRGYYGAFASPSRLVWMNYAEQWILRTMGLEIGHDDEMSKMKC